MSRPWTLGELETVQSLARKGTSLALIGGVLSRDRDELALALWALVGRSPRQALARLKRRAGEAEASRVTQLRTSLRRWAAWMRTVHGRRPLALTRREPAVYGDARLTFPNHYPAPAAVETGDVH